MKTDRAKQESRISTRGMPMNEGRRCNERDGDEEEGEDWRIGGEEEERENR